MNRIKIAEKREMDRNIRWMDKISRQKKQAFIFTVILMIAVHFYAFSNMIINHDCVNAILGR